MASASVRRGMLRVLLAWLAIAAGGCRIAPREQVDECHRLNQTLRSENAQLKDQLLALRSQNQDYSERAVDDARRLEALEQANLRLETSVQAYQDERTRLASAYKELRASLPEVAQPLAFEPRDKPKRSREDSAPARDPELKNVSAEARKTSKGVKKGLMDEQDEAQSSLSGSTTESPKASRWKPSWTDRTQEDTSSTDAESGEP